MDFSDLSGTDLWRDFIFCLWKSKINKTYRGTFRNVVNEELSPFLAGDEQVEEKIRNENKRIYNQTKYIKDWAGYPVCEYTKTEYYPSGEELFLKMLEAVKEAENFIFLEYFIFEDGIMLEQLLAALEEKVKQGVEVRMIYDDVGCISKLPAGYYKKMEARGIKCTAFNPFRPIMSIT